MNSRLNTILTPFFLVAMAACNCDGYDSIRSIDGLHIQAENDSLPYPNAGSGDSLVIKFRTEDHESSVKGSRKCRRKDLAIGFGNRWDTSGFRLYCSQSLISGKDTFAPYRNLLNTRVCTLALLPDNFDRLRLPSSIWISNFSKPALGQSYTFSLEGRTTDNTTHKDSCTLFIY